MDKINIQKIILVAYTIITLLAPAICADIVYATDEIAQNEEQQETTEKEDLEIEEDTELKEPEVSNSDEENKTNDKLVTSEPETQAEEETNIQSQEEPEIDYKNDQNNTLKFTPTPISEPTKQAIDIPAPISATKTVKPGNGTLQEAINTAESGDILQLERGNYYGDKVIIDKSITIRGVGTAYSTGTAIYPEIIVSGTSKNDVVALENFTSSSQPPVNGYDYIDIQSPVTLNADNINFWYIYRGNSSNINSIMLNLGENSSNSTVNLKNTKLISYYEGLNIESSDNTITIDNTEIAGRLALRLANGQNNTLNIKNNSIIDGRSAFTISDEAIAIISQNRLNINITDSTVIGNDANGDRDTHLFSFDGKRPSNNVTIDIKGTSKIDDKNAIKGSTLFNFGEDNTKEHKNEIKIGKDVTLSPNNVEYKYNVDNDYAVVGIYDIEGNQTIKAYTKNEIINDFDFDKDNYKWYKVTNTTSEFIKDNPVTENMDLRPYLSNEVKKVNVKIDGKDETYELQIGQTLSNLINSDINFKNALDALQTASGKNFSRFVDQNGTTVDEKTTIYNDITISPKYNVTITINDIEFELEEGLNLSYLDTKLEQFEKNVSDKKQFSRYVNVTNNKTVSKSAAITENMTLKPVYFVVITVVIDDTTLVYTLDEGKDLKTGLVNSYFYQITQLINSKNKIFLHFESSTNHDAVTYTTPINENTTLTAKFRVKITLHKADGSTKEYFLPEGSKINELGTSTVEEIQNSVVVENKKFTHFVDNNGSTIDFNETSINENIDLIPVYSTKIDVKIVVGDQSKDYEIESGANLNTLTPEQIEAIHTFIKQDNKDFSYFLDNEQNVIHFDTPITKNNTTLTPVYKVTIKVEPKNEAVEQFEIDENVPFGTLAEKLSKFKELSNKNFTKFVYDESKEEVKDTDTFSKHTTIIPMYDITVTVTPKGSESSNLTMAEGATLGSLGDKLDKFEKLTNKKFIEYVDGTNTTVEKDKVLNENITITPKYNILVTVMVDNEKSDEFEIAEGDKLESLGNKLDKFEKLTNKQFDKYVDDKNQDVAKDKALNENITITPKYNVEVTIGKEKYTLPEGKSLNYLGDETVNEIKESVKVSNKEFSHFIDSNEVEVNFDTIINENTTLTPKYNVKITVMVDGKKSDEFEIAEGDKLESLGSQLDKFENLDNKQFDKYVDDKNQDVAKDKALNENITITPKYNVEVTIEKEKYTLPEGKSLNYLGEETVKKIKESVENSNKTFKYFIDSDNKQVDFDTAINENTTLVPNYNILVTVMVDGKKSDEFEIAEGSSLESLGNKLDKFEKLTNKKFDKYVDDKNQDVAKNKALNENITITPKYNVEVTIGKEKYTLPEGKSLNYLGEETVNEIKESVNVSNKEFSHFIDSNEVEVNFDTTINENTTLTPKYNVDVTIGSKKYTLPEGKSLDYLGDETVNEIKESVNVLNKVFSHFIDSDEVEVDFNTTINKNTTLTPKYNVKVTVMVNNEKSDEFEIAEGSSLESLGNKLDKFEKLTNKKFDKYVDDKNQDVAKDKALNENITITPKYNVEVTIGKEKYTLPEGKSLNYLGDETVNEIKESVKVSNKEFSHFINSNEVEVNFDTTINENTTLTPKYNVDVTIGSKKYTLPEGKSLDYLGDETVNEIEESVKVSNKIFSHFINSDEVEVNFDTAINKNTTLTPKYNVKVTVTVNNEKSDEFEIAEGASLESLGNKLDKFEKLTNKEFVEYVDETNSFISKDKILNENIIITPKYNVKVTVGNKTYTLAEGKTLNDLGKSIVDEIKESVKADNKTFKHFIDDNKNIVNFDKAITENSKLTPKYNITISIEKADGTTEDFVLEDGQSLNDLSIEDKSILQAIENDHDSSLKFAGYAYINDDGEEIIIDKNTPLEENIKLTPKYTLNVTDEPDNDNDNDNSNTTTPSFDTSSNQDQTEPSSSNTSDSKTPNTSDNITNFIILGLISFSYIVVYIITHKKNNK